MNYIQTLSLKSMWGILFQNAMNNIPQNVKVRPASYKNYNIHMIPSSLHIKVYL